MRAVILTGAVAGLVLPAGAQTVPADGWRPFTGSWTATGQRQQLRAGPRLAVTVHLSGSLTVSKGEGLRKGFRAEAIAFDDGAGTGIGVMVLTDDKGDQVFCTLKGASSEAGRLIVATISNGTGAYAGLEGDFSFQWRHLTKIGDTEIHGYAVDMEGRTRRSTPAPPPPAEKSK